jgi:hypothetical protein
MPVIRPHRRPVRRPALLTTSGGEGGEASAGGLGPACAKPGLLRRRLRRRKLRFGPPPVGSGPQGGEGRPQAGTGVSCPRRSAGASRRADRFDRTRIGTAAGLDQRAGAGHAAASRGRCGWSGTLAAPQGPPLVHRPEHVAFGTAPWNRGRVPGLDPAAAWGAAPEHRGIVLPRYARIPVPGHLDAQAGSHAGSGPWV